MAQVPTTNPRDVFTCRGCELLSPFSDGKCPAINFEKCPNNSGKV